jgi:cadmium resistance transport/sequestration family protein
MHWLSVLGRAIVAFAATNIDDIFLLTLFFAQKNLKRWHVVAGQYLGLAGLIAISLVGYFARLVIPHAWIGLLGLAPIAIGIKKLIDWKRSIEADTKTQTGKASVFTVAAVTFANGGDNIGIYIPLFANSDAQDLLITLVAFSALIAVWCVVGYYLGNHPTVKQPVDRYGHILVPFVLIGLGIYIIIESR